MTKELKDKWVAALRSGKYKQARGALYGTRDRLGELGGELEYGYCCLGVLCDIAFPEDRDHRESCATLSESERQQTGLKLTEQDILIGMNDTYRETFAQIADWIEENL